jgi:hypothetical protein
MSTAPAHKHTYTHLAVLVVQVVLPCSLPALALKLLLHRHTDASLLQRQDEEEHSGACVFEIVH